MRQALEQAAEASAAGEVPVGAVVLSASGVLLGAASNSPISRHDPTAHAEIGALRAAALAVGNYRLPGCTLYVTIEPCTMCVGAMVHARIAHLVFGAPEPRFGAVVSSRQLLDAEGFNHNMTYQGGILADECGEMMRRFFRARRRQDGRTSGN